MRSGYACVGGRLCVLLLILVAAFGCGERQETDDFRILLSSWGQIQNEVAGLRQSNNLLINSAKNVEGTDLSSPLDTTLEALDGFEEILSGGEIENEDLAEYVDELRDGFESLQEALANIKRR